MVWILLALVVLGAVAALPLMLESRRQPVRELREDGMPGQLAKLSQGRTHYRWLGPARGPAIVAIHGLTTPSPVWEEVAAELARIGFRTLVYDLYGRGHSDDAPGRQDADFFLRQLDDLLAHEGLDENLSLMGYSMGGSIATAFAARNPHRMLRLMLIAPAGVEYAESGFARFCRRVPLFGDWLHGTFGGFLLARRIAKAEAPDWLAELQSQELQRRGFVPAVLASSRGILAEDRREAHAVVKRSMIETLTVWGQQDTVIPISALGTLAQWNRSAYHEMIEEAGHALIATHAREVGGHLRRMLTEER